MAAAKWRTNRVGRQRRRPRAGVTLAYLPRCTLEVEAVIAIEELAAEEGITFGLALEKMLNESDIFQQFLERVKNPD